MRPARRKISARRSNRFARVHPHELFLHIRSSAITGCGGRARRRAALMHAPAGGRRGGGRNLELTNESCAEMIASSWTRSAGGTWRATPRLMPRGTSTTATGKECRARTSSSRPAALGVAGAGVVPPAVRVAEGLTGEPLVLRVWHLGASEIYVDGRLIGDFGEITPEGDEEYNPRGLFVPFVFAGADAHVIAVRYSYKAVGDMTRERERWLSRGMSDLTHGRALWLARGGYTPGFSLVIAPGQDAALRRSKSRARRTPRLRPRRIVGCARARPPPLVRLSTAASAETSFTASSSPDSPPPSGWRVWRPPGTSARSSPLSLTSRARRPRPRR